MSGPKLNLRVRSIEPLSPLLKRFELEMADGGEVPPFGPGAHLRFNLQGDHQRWKNAYSLVTPPTERRRYAVIVRRVEHSRGGSAFMHETVKPGQILEASVPANLFPVSQIARKHLLISGGIGITPFLSYLAAFKSKAAGYELHHFCRAKEAEIFGHLLRDHESSRIHIHAGTEFNLSSVLSSQPLGTHLYTCGPEGLMDLVLDTARTHGWPASKLHSESFGSAHMGGAPFIAILKRSGAEIAVREDQTLLEAIEEAGFEPTNLCRGGACGECLTRVLEGEPEHRDHYLDEGERASNCSIMICVSRAKTNRIVLDL